MELLEHSLELGGNRQAQMCCIFEQRYTFIGQVEADHCGAQCVASTYHMQVDDVRNANQKNNQHLLKDAPAQEIREGDELLITGETTGAYELMAKDLHDGKGKLRTEIKKGEYFAIKTDKIVRRGDRIFLLKIDENQ